MKTIYKSLILAAMTLQVSLELNAQSYDGEETSKINVPAEVLDSLRVELIAPNVSGARDLVESGECAIDGSDLSVTLNAEDWVRGATYRLQVVATFGTQTQVIYALDITVPYYAALSNTPQEYEDEIIVVSTIGDGDKSGADATVYSKDGDGNAHITTPLTVSGGVSEGSPYGEEIYELNVVVLTAEQKAEVEAATGTAYDYCDTNDAIEDDLNVTIYTDAECTQKVGSTAKTEYADTPIAGDFFNLQDGESISAGTYYARIEGGALGENAHAEGVGTTAEGLNSHAEGAGTKASGNQSHAEGYETIASGNKSHAEGARTIASGNQSHAEGAYTTASGENSHAEGAYTTASGNQSHAEGGTTTASGDNSHAEGAGTTASGENSHAEGGTTTASGNQSHAEGAGTTASGDYSHAEGTYTTASGENSHAEGVVTTASGKNAHAEGYETTASGENSHAEGGTTTASGNQSHAEGAGTTASGDYSHAEGNGATASGDNSHAEGFNTTASGNQSHAEGIGTIASQDNQHVCGKFNVEDTDGDYALIVGNGTANDARYNAFAVRKGGAISLWDRNGVERTLYGDDLKALSQLINPLQVVVDTGSFTVVTADERLDNAAFLSRMVSYNVKLVKITLPDVVNSIENASLKITTDASLTNIKEELYDIECTMIASRLTRDGGENWEAWT